MAKNSKQTSRPIASKASKVLRDGRFSKTSKSVAGSALAQTKPKKQATIAGSEMIVKSTCLPRKGNTYFVNAI